MTEKSKYTDEQYLDFDYYGPDDEYTNHSQKIVAVREQQECVSIFADPHAIEPGTLAIRETALHEDRGWESCYLCLDHADDYLTEMYGE